jgi:hypothetical protein
VPRHFTRKPQSRTYHTRKPPFYPLESHLISYLMYVMWCVCGRRRGDTRFFFCHDTPLSNLHLPRCIPHKHTTKLMIRCGVEEGGSGSNKGLGKMVLETSQNLVPCCPYLVFLSPFPWVLVLSKSFLLPVLRPGTDGLCGGSNFTMCHLKPMISPGIMNPFR